MGLAPPSPGHGGQAGCELEVARRRRLPKTLQQTGVRPFAGGAGLGGFLDSGRMRRLNADMLKLVRPARVLWFTAPLLLLAACASRMEGPPPVRPAPLASSPLEVSAALPGTWEIAVNASAEALARAQYQPRVISVTRQESGGPATSTTTTVSERFDPNEFAEARSFWRSALKQPDMRWQLVFKADGTGEHRAVLAKGAAQAVPFRWQLNGWLLKVAYAEGAPFKTFEVEMRSAQEIRYPM